MKIFNIVGIVVLSLCILISPVYATTNGTSRVKIESNIQIKDGQTQKKETILNTLTTEDLILTEVKTLNKEQQEDVVCLALNMFHEARGSTVKDQIASTYVVFNRYMDTNYPLTLKNKKRSLCNIIFDKWQFCWTNGHKIPKPDVKKYGEKNAWEKAQKLAMELYNNPIHKQMASEFQLQHYVVTPLIYDKHRPKWINKRKLTIQIGKHSYMSINSKIENSKENQIKYKHIIDRAYYSIFGKIDENIQPTLIKIK